MKKFKDMLAKIWLNGKDITTKYVDDTEVVRGYVFRSLDVTNIDTVLPKLQAIADKLDLSCRFGKGQAEYGQACDYYNNRPIRKSYIYIGKDTREEKTVDVLDSLV